MKIFGREKREKESNVARTPESVAEEIVVPTKSKVAFLLWNIFSIALYTCYTLFVTYKLSEKNFLSKVILYLLIAYAVIFLLLIILSLNARNKMKNRLKNYKSAVKFFKYAIQIINFVLSIITAISAFITTGTTDVSAVLYAVLSLVITVFFIFFEIVKIIIRKNIPLIKYNFLEMRDKEGKRAYKEKHKADQK